MSVMCANSKRVDRHAVFVSIDRPIHWDDFTPPSSDTTIRCVPVGLVWLTYVNYAPVGCENILVEAWENARLTRLTYAACGYTNRRNLLRAVYEYLPCLTRREKGVCRWLLCS